MSYVKNEYVDFAFLDVNLSGTVTGIDLAKMLKEIQPNIEVVFVTGSDDYARDAFRVGGRGYLTKPYDRIELDETIETLKKLALQHRSLEENKKEEKKGTFIKTFGNFDVFIDNKPITYKNSKSKELLAFLVDQRGGTVTGTQIFLALWEQQDYTTATSTYVRRTVRALKSELEAYGIDDIFIISRNCYSIDTSKFVCDFFEVLNGSKAMAETYNGEYMIQYYWGENTIPLIERNIEKINKK